MQRIHIRIEIEHRDMLQLLVKARKEEHTGDIHPTRDILVLLDIPLEVQSVFEMGGGWI